MITPHDFVIRFREAFGNAELPLVFWYSSKDTPAPEKTVGCFVKDLRKARNGELMTLDVETIGCAGGKLYTGFTGIPTRIPHFVSEKEKYKKTPKMVIEGIRQMNIPRATQPYIHFNRIDRIGSFQDIEGLIFFATPDVLTGLVAWTLFDTNREDAVSVPFGSGCSSMIARVVAENRMDGKRTFLGLFDPSVRPHMEADVLSFAVPMSRFREMADTMTQCCLYNTHAWSKVKSRINGEN